MMYFFRFNLLALVLLALLSVCIARPSPSSLKTIASSTNSKSSIKSPSQKIAEKNNLAPSVASIVEASQSVSQESVANINTPQSQDPESLNYSSKDVVHNSQSNVVSTSLTEDGLVKPSANLNVQSEAPVVAKNQEALVAEAAPVVQSAPQIVQPAPVNQVVPVVQSAPAPVVQATPVVESAPQIVQPAPVNQLVPVVQSAPQIVQPAPVNQVVPVVQSAPQIVQPAPVNQVVPVVQSAPQIVQPAPVNQVVPVVQSAPAPVVQAFPVVQSAPQIVQPAPVNQVVPVVQSAPQIVQPAPVNQLVPVVQSAPVNQAAPVVSEVDNKEVLQSDLSSYNKPI